jgi:hypothetical protein
MNELAIVARGEDIGRTAVAVERCALEPVAVERAASDERSTASRVWRSIWLSRVLVWVTGCVAASTLGMAVGGTGPVLGIARAFGRVGNVLAAPAVRWDGTWYLYIAHNGYAGLSATRFFPLYPLLIKAVSLLWIPPAIVGVAVSLGSMFVALMLIHRLATLELGERVASLSVELIAFCPVAVYFSAVYSESLLMALSAGAVLSARRGRWALAGALGGLGALTRVTGFVVVVPVVIMFLYGPRTDRAPDRSGPRWVPRYRIDRSLLWAALIPAGTALYACYLKLKGYGFLAFMHAQTHLLHHQLMVPVVTVMQALEDGWDRLQLGMMGLGASLSSNYQSLVMLVALTAALLALRSVWRRLPWCYSAFVVAGLLLPLSSPTVGDPLKGLGRYESVLFPLYIGAAAWALERGVKRPLLIAFAVVLMLFTAQFATWHVVGSQLL